MNVASITSSRGSLFGGLLLLCALTPGCSALNALNFQTPSASYHSVSVADVSPGGVTANFDIDVRNPNAFEIPVSGATYKLSLSGVQVVDDQASPSASVPASGSLPVTVPVHLRFDQLIQAEKEIAKSGGNIPFDFDGGLEFSAGKLSLGRSIKVPLHFAGTLPLRDAVSKALHDPATLADLLRDPNARKICESAIGRRLLGGILDR